MIYKSYLGKRKFPWSWKKTNVVLLHKKNDNQSLKNYRPILLLRICDKVFERLLYNSLLNFVFQNDLTSPAQLGSKSGGSLLY